MTGGPFRAPDPDAVAPTRLARRLGTTDAVIIGLGSMIGAGVFAAIGPAAAAAGSALLIALVVAGFVAYCNATSSAQLAALYPRSGGTYAYAAARLGPSWAFVAGWGFVGGKLASCAAMALTFGSYTSPALARPLGIGAVILLTAVNYRGVRKTALVTRVIVGVVLTALAAVVAAPIVGGVADLQQLRSFGDAGLLPVLRAAGFLFFAFAGYARIATLGEEVVDPGRTIPRAIPLALAITLVVYAAVAASALATLGPAGLATAPAPLAAVVEAAGVGWLAPVVRLGATVASLGVLLSLLVGVSRTVFAMAADGELPRALAAVHPRHRVPYRAEVAVGLLVCVTIALVDLRDAIGFSACTVLVYYAITNVAALTLQPGERRWSPVLAAFGLVGCAALAFSLPATALVAGLGLLAGGFVARAALRASRR